MEWSRKCLSTNFIEQNVFSVYRQVNDQANRSSTILYNIERTLSFSFSFVHFKLNMALNLTWADSHINSLWSFVAFILRWAKDFPLGSTWNIVWSFCSLNLCARPTSETYRRFVAWIKPFVLCIFLEGATIREKRLMSLSHPTSSPTLSHTSVSPC